MGAAAIPLTLGTGVAQLYAADQQARAMRQQGKFARAQSKLNAKMQEIQAEDAIQRGNEAVQDYQKQYRQIVGSQKAAYGASGVALDSDVVQDVEDSTRDMAMTDMMRIRNNAYKEAFGYKQQSRMTALKGEASFHESRMRSRSTLLAGGISAIGSGIQAYSQTQ